MLIINNLHLHFPHLLIFCRGRFQVLSEALPEVFQCFLRQAHASLRIFQRLLRAYLHLHDTRQSCRLSNPNSRLRLA